MHESTSSSAGNQNPVAQLEKRFRTRFSFQSDSGSRREADPSGIDRIATADSTSNIEDSDTVDLPPFPKSFHYSPPVYSIGDLTDPTGKQNTQLEDFKIIQLAGKGGFGKVYQVCRESDKRIFALKTMRKDMIIEMGQAKNVVNEKNILKKCGDTRFVVHLLCTFQDSVHLFMVQEFLPGGSLLGYIRENGYLKNDDARFYAAEVFLGVSYLHSNGIIYRDLKPDNILFDMEGHIRIVDLGFAKQLGSTGLTNTFCGTPSYLAPEVVLKKSYGLEVDWWAYGIIIFQLCCGCSPFQEAKHMSTFARILRCSIRWPPNPQFFFNDDGFDLISWLLELEPENRPFMDEIKSHSWFDGLDFDALYRKEIPPPTIVQEATRRKSVIVDTSITDSVKRILTDDPNYVGQIESEPVISVARHGTTRVEDLFIEF